MRVWKTLKVFISSTFKDLELERDRLAHIFQELQDKIFERRLHLVPYDLRWQEQGHQDNLVGWCLDMVGQAQYFVGILGYRYGWRPQYDEKGKANEQRLSITAMEIEKACRDIPPQRRFFCCGDPAQYSLDQLNTESEQDKKDLEILKQSLKDKGEKVFDYGNTTDLLKIVADEMEKIIALDYPPGQKAELEINSHEEALQEIIEEKCQGFIGRESFLRLLEEHCNDGERSPYLIIHAVAGTGKSALLAHFLSRHQQEIPTIVHFSGAGGDSRTVKGLLDALGRQLKEIGLLEQEPEVLPERLALQVRGALQNCNRRLIIAVDGLDELDEEARKLNWLPEISHSRARIILTTRPVSPWQRLQQIADARFLELPPLQEKEINEIIAGYCREHGRKLSENDQSTLAKRAAGNPLFLKVALDEMAAGGLAVGQLEESVDALFRQILARLKKKYGDALVTDYLGLIACSRNGLAMPELREILIKIHGLATIADLMMPVHRALANFIILREKLLNFFHPEFERSIKILLGKAQSRHYHQLLASYFRDKGYDYHRSLSELPYHLQWGEQYAPLLQLFADIEFLENKCEGGMLIELRQDFEFVINSIAVPVPEELKIEITSQVMITKKLVALLWRILEMDIRCLGRHPQTLFQSLWNRGYWYDSPEAAKHYLHVPDAPWHREGEKLYSLVEYWRGQKEQNRQFTWLKSLRPPAERLESPLLKIFKGHEGGVYGLEMTLDGSKIISGSYDGTVRVWDVVTGESIMVIDTGGSEIADICISADGRKVAAAGANGLLRIFDIQSGEMLHDLRGHQGKVNGVDLSADGRLLVSGGQDHTLRLWSIEGEELACLKTHPSPVYCVTVTNDGKLVLAGHEDGAIVLWQVANQTKRLELREHTNTVNSIRINAGKFISSSRDKSAKLWELSSGQCLMSIEENNMIYDACLSDDGDFVVTAGWDKKARVWNIADQKCTKVLADHENSVFAVCLDQEGERLATASNDAYIRLWDLTVDQENLFLEGHIGKIREATPSPSTCFVATAGNDAKIRIWDSRSGRLIRTMQGHDLRITALAFTPDGQKIISGSTDSTVRIWDFESGQCLHVLQKHEFEIWCVSINGTGKYIASGAMDDKVVLWQAQTGECIDVFKGHVGPVTSICMSYDGDYLVSGSFDNTVQLWDIEQKAPVWILEGHQGPVSSVALSEDKTLIASASKDESVLIWDTATGECLMGLGHPTGVTQVSFSEDGSKLITNTVKNVSADFYQAVGKNDVEKHDDILFVWDVMTGECLDYIEGSAHHRQLLNEKNPYAVIRDHELLIDNRQDEFPTYIFPVTLNQTQMLSSNVVCGTTHDQLYLLELRGDNAR